MNRYRHDLGHQSHMVGKIGRLQTHSVIPVVGGDTVELDWRGAVRLSPLVRYMTTDARCDLFAFYVPHRHLYGTNWETFIQSGFDEAVTFPTSTAPTGGAAYLGAPLMTGTLARWHQAGYNRIWNRFFRIPTDETNRMAETDAPAGEGRIYGQLCARLPANWSMGVDDEITSTDREVAVSAGVFDIIDLARARAQYKTEVTRQWFGQYYNDIMQSAFGGKSTTDADERPTLLARKNYWLSGYDVDGTGDATLGTYTGKSITATRLMVPRKFCPEHGAIWLMSLVRFPSIHLYERHYLFGQSQPDYTMISGDPDLWATQPPEIYQADDFFTAGTAVNVGLMPYGFWYRNHPSVVHTNFTQNGSFAFCDTVPTDADTARYCQAAEYNDVFQTNQYGHWQHHSGISGWKASVVPGPKSSMFAGV